MKTVKVWARTDIVGSKTEFAAEFDAADWDEMGEKERGQAILDQLLESCVLEYGWEDK